MTDLKPYTLGGRCRTGSDGTGRIFHALEAGSENTFATALCGAKPGRLSVGWSTWQPEGQQVTCPKCIKKAALIAGRAG